MISNTEQSLKQAIEELTHLTQERGRLENLCSNWEVAYAKLKAEHDLLKNIYADMKVDSDKYKGYSVELRTRLQDIAAVIVKAVSDARSYSFPDGAPKTTAATEQPAAETADNEPAAATGPIPAFLREGPANGESRFLLQPIIQV